MVEATDKESLKSNTLYGQLADKLRSEITSGKYNSGSKLPTEFELRRATNLSRSTIRHALDLLVNDGTLVKIHGKGTFVRENVSSDTPRTQFLSLTSNAERLGVTMTTKLVDARLTSPTKSQQEFFTIEPTNQLVELTRLRYIDNEPFCVETNYFTSQYKSLINKNLSGSLYKLLKTDYKIVPAGGHKTFAIAYASANEAFLLQVERNTPLMEITDYVYGPAKKPLHISRQVIRSDKYKYELQS
ncbi:GntR family transcriptional regulator [Lacticaseibacillus zhaodongensis]|uniref:GntR family transcriptional regulator n=1 Tax=Lacticaseibacillus zhaodongensis TaxID=2668065 RepID=UPI0012D30D1B|nr:GntR family transcriptional regulator [Lacticaseibacillus zhaodongensis]